MERQNIKNDSLLIFMEYEIRSSWLTSRIGWCWGQEILGRYFAWKVRRKYKRYKKSKMLGFLKLKNF